MVYFYVFVMAIWHEKQVDLNSHRVSPFHYKQTDSPSTLVTQKAIHPKLLGNCSFPRNSRARKLGEISTFYAVLDKRLDKASYIFKSQKQWLIGVLLKSFLKNLAKFSGKHRRQFFFFEKTTYVPKTSLT